MAVLSADFDRLTGETLTGWAAVQQSIRELILTSFGDRVIREYYGSGIPTFLGRENMTEAVLSRMASVLSAAIDVFEPRFKVSRITFTKVGSDGRITMRMEGEYRPLALEGNLDEAGSEVFEFPL